MPRPKTAPKSAEKVSKVQKSHKKRSELDVFTTSSEKPSTTLDLTQFKFEKKPHIKIEFVNDSTSKDEATDKGLWEPANWRDFLLNLRNMRANNDAPVDSMGCHMSMDQGAPPEVNCLAILQVPAPILNNGVPPYRVIRYQSLISLMLSSQTKDQVTFAAMERLRERGLTVDNVLKMSDEDLGQLIYPVGFWKTKVKYIKKTTQTLKEQYNGDIPDSVEKLCKLTGVGPKMAHICMKVAWDKVTGIGVDTHVHRISNRIGWVKNPTPTPEDTRKSLESWLPFDIWSEVNHLMVGFGQTICLPIGPMCHECLNRDICPSSGLGRKSPKKTPQKIKSEINDDDDFEKMLSPIKKRATTVKDETQRVKKISQKLKVEVNDNLEEKTQQNKVSPMKKKILAVKSECQNKILQKRKMTSKIELLQDREHFVSNSLNVLIDKKSPQKRKSPRNTVSDTKVQAVKKRSTKKTV